MKTEYWMMKTLKPNNPQVAHFFSPMLLLITLSPYATQPITLAHCLSTHFLFTLSLSLQTKDSRVFEFGLRFRLGHLKPKLHRCWGFCLGPLGDATASHHLHLYTIHRFGLLLLWIDFGGYLGDYGSTVGLSFDNWVVICMAVGFGSVGCDLV